MTITQPPKNLLIIIAGIFGFLVISSIITFILMKINKEKNYDELEKRIKSWWMMVFIFSVAMLLSKKISLLFFAFISFLALKEYFTIIPIKRSDRRVLFWAYLAIPIQFLWIAKAWYGMFIIFIPVYMFLFIPFRMILIGETKGFLQSVGIIHWGMMMAVFNISHLAFLLVLPKSGNPVAGGAGLVLYLVMLTQLNDVAQYIWGKSFGNKKIISKVSPNKTIAGFIGGVCTTLLLAILLAKYLTPFNLIHSVCAGIIIGISGFIGDVTISALKRDLGIKDSGNILPGHGGILDRIDSATYTFPLFFHFVYYFYY